MNPRLRIPNNLFNAMIAQAKSESPNECCGLLAGCVAGTEYVVIEQVALVNSAATPWNRFESSPASMFAAMKQLRARALEVLAVYHSHPTGGSSPSAIDREMNYAADVANIIIDLTKEPAEVRAWRVQGDRISEWEYEVCEDVGKH